MEKYKIFVSGVQKELKEERRAVKKLVQANSLLKKYFDVFLFEDHLAESKPASKVYIDKVKKSDIYIGILGKEYGDIGTDRISPTEKEFRTAKSKGKEILIYIKGTDDSQRDTQLKELINEIQKADEGYIYKRFKNINSLNKNVYNSLIEYLEAKGVISEFPFDSRICEDATYKKIKETLVKEFLKNRARKIDVAIPKISTKNFLIKTIKIVKVKNNILRPTNAAILFFCSNPQEFIPQSTVKIVRFKGTTGIEFIDSQELTGSFYNILDSVEKFFRRNTRLASKIVEFKRVDIPEYPFEAIREGVINAMAHRDYSRSGANIQIEIYDDRIEITNPGRLLSGLDIKHLEGIHETRNKEICKIFHETKDMEKYGTGIRKMNDWMKKYGLKKPEFNQPGNFFKIVFYGPGDKILDLVSDIPKERQIDLTELGLNERQIEILRLMVNENQKITIKKYVEFFKNISDKTAIRDMKKLIEMGFVKKVGYKKGAYFEAK